MRAVMNGIRRLGGSGPESMVFASELLPHNIIRHDAGLVRRLGYTLRTYWTLLRVFKTDCLQGRKQVETDIGARLCDEALNKSPTRPNRLALTNPFARVSLAMLYFTE